MTEPAYPDGWGNPTLAFPFTGLGGPNPVAVGEYDLLGWSVIENTGAAPSVLIIRDGADATGVSLGPIRLNASQSEREWFGPGGIRLERGAFTHQFLGITDGTLFLRAC